MPSKLTRRLRRGTLTSKHGNVDYYKGYRARTEGVHTSKGAFVIRPERLMKIMAPDLTGFQLTPYVHTKTLKIARGHRVPEWKDDGSAARSPQIAKQLK